MNTMSKIRVFLLALLLLPSAAHAAITFIDTSSHSGSATTRTPSEPTGTQEDDLVLAFCTKAETDGAWTDPADFTQIDDVQFLATGRSYLGYKVRGSTAGSGYAFSHSGASQQMNCSLATFRGVDTSTPLDVTYVRGSHYNEDLDELIAPPAITTATNGAWVVVAYHEQSDTSFTAVAPTNYTIRVEQIGAAGTVQVVATREIASAGAETPGAWQHTSLATSASALNFTIALKPAVIAPTFSAGPTPGSITATTIPFTFTSDTTGTVKGVACPDGQASPSVAQVIAGDCTGDVDAVATISEAVTAAVGDGGTFSGLSASTTYDTHFAIDATTDSAAISSVANQTTSAAGTPEFDSVMSCSALDEDTYRCTYDANATADDIFVCVMKKDASAPANGAAVEACSGGIGDATEASTGSSDQIDIDVSMTGGAPPIADIYGALKEDGGAYSAVDSELDELLDPSGIGRQYVAKSGSPGGGELGLLDGASPAAADGDYIDAPTHVDSFDIGPAAHALTINANTTFSIAATGDLSQLKFTRRFYDVSEAAWSDNSPVLYCVNNLAPVYVGPGDWEGEVPYLFERNASISFSLDQVWEDTEQDSMTHNVLNMPVGGSEDGEDISGAFTTFGYYPTVTLEVLDECTDGDSQVVQFVVGFRIPSFTWLMDESFWQMENIFAANDPDFNVPLPRIVGW